MDRRALGYSALLLFGLIIASVLLNRGLNERFHSAIAGTLPGAVPCSDAGTIPGTLPSTLPGSLPSTLPGVTSTQGFLLILDGVSGGVLISTNTDVGQSSSFVGKACDTNGDDISDEVIFNWSVNGGGDLSATTTLVGAETTVFTATVSGTFILTLTVDALSTGITPPDQTVTIVIGVKAPGAPTNVQATPSNAQATVSWSAPASDGGSSITRYNVTVNPAPVSGATTRQTADGITTSLVFTNLVNGTPYTFTVTATNAVGTSAASDASAAVTPAKVPDAPTNVQATAGDKQATVSWATSTATGTGLTNGVTYTFTVTNVIGTSAASAGSNPVTPAAVPDAPTIGTATSTSGQAEVSWSAPASDGGSAITSYTVTGSPGGVATVDGSTLIATVTG